MKNYSAVKRNELSGHENTEKINMHITKEEKPIWKDYMLHDSS